MAIVVNKDIELIGVIPTGRPSSYCQDIADEICKMLWEGYSLIAICKMEDMPPIRTVYGWMDQQPSFQQDYARARARQAFTHADEIQVIADDPTIAPDRARVMIDARKWKAARQNWRYFGDKVQVETREANKELGDEELPGSMGWLARTRIGRQGDED